MREINYTHLESLNNEEFRIWVASLSTDSVYALLHILTPLVRARFGENAIISTSTYQAPKIIHYVN